MSEKYDGIYQKTDKPVKNKTTIKFISIGLIICILLCIIGPLCFKYIPIFNDELKSIPETDLSGCTFFQTPKENIVSNDDGICFVNNELLLTLADNFSQDDFESILLKYDAKIVGEIKSLNYYQIQLDSTKTYAEICTLIDNLTQYDLIKTAEVNHAFRLDSNKQVTNDSEWKNEWSNVPSGSNWGVEAIEADEAWKYTEKLDSVNIGIMDTMFYTEHEDLSFAERPLGNVKAKEIYKEFDSHGTHVSGIIGATHNNKVGISGVSIKSNLYGVSLWGLMSGYEITTMNTYRLSLFYLIALKHCKVINISMNDRLLEFCAAQEDEASPNTPAKDELKVLGSELSEFLKLMLDEKHEFIICVASGNQNGGENKYLYFKKDLEDTQIPYDYYSYSDFEKYLSGIDSAYDYSRYENRQEEIKQSLISAENIACNNMFTTITDDEVRDRIIIVGAVANQYDDRTQEHNGYSLAPFSQCGDQVDIVAPGYDIYSTVVKKGWFNRLKSSYKDCSGTSQATPMVAGTAGLIFSANPKLKGSQVKDILRTSSIGEYGTEKYGLLNAKNAVEHALAFDIHDSITTTPEISDTLTFEQAKAIAKDYWNLSDYETTTEEGIKAAIFGTADDAVNSNGIKYYCFTYRALIEEGSYAHWTTWDQVFVNSKAGECSYELTMDGVSSPNGNNQSITITDDSSAEDLKKAIIGQWYDPNFAVNYYAFFENGNCKMMFSDAKSGTFEITADKTLKINMPWTTKKLKWDSNCLYSSVGWYFTSDGKLIIEGNVLQRQ